MRMFIFLIFKYQTIRIINKRKEFIKDLRSISKEIHHGITGGDEILDIEYEPNVDVDNIERFINNT